MKYLSKDPIFCTPSTEDYEKSWERVFGDARSTLVDDPYDDSYDVNVKKNFQVWSKEAFGVGEGVI